MARRSIIGNNVFAANTTTKSKVAAYHLDCSVESITMLSQR